MIIGKREKVHGKVYNDLSVVPTVNKGTNVPTPVQSNNMYRSLKARGRKINKM